MYLMCGCCLYVLPDPWQEAGGQQREVDLVVEELERSQTRVRELEQQLVELQQSVGQERAPRLGGRGLELGTPSADEFWDRQLQVRG